MTNIVIDLSKLVTSDLTVYEYCLAYLIYHKDENGIVLLMAALHEEFTIPPITALEQKEYIIVTDSTKLSGYEARQKLNELFIETTVKEKIEDIDRFVQDFRLLFKATKKPGAMGDPNACKEKLIRFLKKYPKYSKEQIMNAAKTYIMSQGRDNYRFLQQADYFISKQEQTSRIERSRLLTLLEEGTQGVLPLDSGIVSDNDYTQMG